MANPRQRRKARSATHRAVSHSRNVKRNLKKNPPIRGPASVILAERWDKRKTVRQNYAALGLAHTLNPTASGGVERIDAPTTTITEDASANQTAVASTSSAANGAAPIPKGHGRIIRDEKGHVLRIELAEDDEEEAMEQDEREVLDQDMEALGPELDSGLVQKWVTSLGGTQSGAGNVVEALERISATTQHNGQTTLSVSNSGAGSRTASAGELGYMQRLVQKYGNDVERMARDRRLNPEQRTAGQLSRSLHKCGL